MSDVIMDGVWIINVRKETESSHGMCEFMGIVIGLLAGLIVWYVVVGVIQYLSDCDIEGRWGVVLAIPILLLSSFLGWGYGDLVGHESSSGDVIYDVLIGDNISFNEFTEQYEIISQNGNIYTVKEKKK